MIDLHPTPNLSLIVACAQNMAIGKDNDLLWHISDDLKRFKALTSGHPVIMGRRTFESLPKKPLPKRRNIVLTHDPNFHYPLPPTASGTLEVAHSIPQVLKLIADEPESFVIGGAAVYNAFLPMARTLYLTWVYRDFEADVFFPTIDGSLFRQVLQSERFVDPESGLEYSYAEYARIGNPL